MEHTTKKLFTASLINYSSIILIALRGTELLPFCGTTFNWVYTKEGNLQTTLTLSMLFSKSLLEALNLVVGIPFEKDASPDIFQQLYELFATSNNII
jgi:hypothetical protein